MTHTLGIDEAGRGPVIGPLVIAGVVIDEKKEEFFREQGVKDSKLLSELQRERLAEVIKEHALAYHIIVVDVDEIDQAVNDENGHNLNWLEADKAVDIINKLQPKTTIVDCPSTSPKKFEDYLRQKMDNKNTKLVVEHKADVNHISAAAASILAKSTREAKMMAIKKQYGNCGSGYPSDPLTQSFLQKYWNKHPEIFRKSWASWKTVAKKHEQKGIQEF